VSFSKAGRSNKDVVFGEFPYISSVANANDKNEYSYKIRDKRDRLKNMKTKMNRFERNRPI
jgi:hypothetical protein